MRVLVAGWVGSTNLGDELVFAGLCRLLAQRGIWAAAISIDPAATRRVHGLGAVSPRDLPGLTRAVGEADALLFGGGGLLQDETSPLNLPYHLSRVALARVRATPHAGIGLGAGRLETRAGRALVAAALRGAVGITVRDAASRDLLDEVGVPGARVAADLAFALDPPPPASAPGPGTLAVSLRPWSAARGRLPAAARGDTTPQPHVDALARALDRTAAATGLAVRFVALQADRDDAFHRRVAAGMRTSATFATPELDRLLGEFAAATAVVAMRYHGGVAATLAGRPSVLIGYAGKVDALAGELGAGARLLGWDPDALATLPDALAAVTDHHAHVREVRDDLRARQRPHLDLLDDLRAAATRLR